MVAMAYGDGNLSFGPEYLIPKPFDPRLIVKIASAVARAAETSGVASRPIKDMEAYIDQLQQFVYQSGTFMKPLFQIAKRCPDGHKRIVYAEGEEERVLRAVQVVVDEGLARPILVARGSQIDQRIERFGLRLKRGVDYDLVDIEFDDRHRDFWTTYWKMAERKGVTAQLAKIEMRRRLTLIGCMMIHKGYADGLICGTFGTTAMHMTYIEQVIGKKAGTKLFGAMTGLFLPNRQVFLTDTHINCDPTADELADITIMAADEMRCMGIIPKVALLSHSNFGTSNSPSALKMRETLAILRERAPDLEVDGEMHGDSALDPAYRYSVMPNSTLKGEANLLVMPNIEAANIAYNLLKTSAGNNIAIGPILLGANSPVNVLTPSATVRRIVNMTTLTVVEANSKNKR